MSWLDTAVIAVYLIATTLLGCSFMFRKETDNAVGFMTGGGKLPTWTVAMSIFATHVSSIAFLGLPAKSFLTNWNPYVLSLTVPIAAAVAALWFVPFYRNSGGVSAYSFLESRYGIWARLYASACFLTMQTMRSGFILFLTAILLNTLFGWPIVWIIAVTGLLTAVYSMMGGISAVVWTDAIQSLILIAGTFICLAVLVFSLPDASAAFSSAFAEGKFSLGSFSFTDWKDETFWVIFVYAMFINLQNFGIDQSFTQRYIAAKTSSAAKTSLLSSAFMYLVNTAFFVLIGTLLWMYVQSHPGAVPAEVLEKSDAVFPWFIVNRLPVGVSGLLVAAIIAAAMSTVSSTLNSGATVLQEDYRKRFFSHLCGEKADEVFLRATTMALGALSVAVGIAVMNVKSALTAFWAVQSVFSGGMLGLFLLAMMAKRSRGAHAAVATVIGVLVLAWVTFGQDLTGFSVRLHVNLAIVLGTIALVAAGAALSLVGGKTGAKPGFAGSKPVVLLVSALFAFVAAGDVHTWVGGDHQGGGWNNPLNWKNASGENECPGKDDVALFNEWSLTVVANDADAELVGSLAAVQFKNWSYIYKRGPTVIFDFANDHHVDCAIYGDGGKFVKRGAGTLYLENVDSSVSPGAYGICCNLIPSPGGMLVEEGTVWFPQNSSLVFGSASAGIEVARGATVYLPNGANTMINWLKGEGTVTIDSEVERNLQVGMASESAPACEFAGRLTGKFSVNSYAGLSLSGTESDIAKLQILRRAPGDHMNNGYVAMSRLGCKNEVSSIGTGPLYLLYCSSFRYLGDGETSDKNIYYDTRTLTGSPDAIIFDGGPNGGLNLTGSISSYGNKESMMTLILDGSNSVACTVSGGFTASFAADADDVAYTPYILKRGSGVWRFADNANRTHAGVYEVREGTLQFDTIAEAGEMCSLGFATNLSDNYQGAYDPQRKKLPYAYRLGSPDATNAVFEYTGSVPGVCATRPAVLSGDAHIRASGAKGAPLDFSGVSALSEGSFTLVLDGANSDANVIREVTDGAGVVSLVKDGPGSWTLGGRQSFSGSLTVRQGTLTVAGPRPFTYFRATFNDGYGSPYTTYITEVGLYDAAGVRRNLNLAFELPAGKKWTDSWTPKNVAPLLPEGGISYDGGGNLAYYLYGPDDYALGKLTDATSASAQFSRALSPSSPLTVTMRLPSDVPEIAYFDFVQNSGNYLSEGHQTPSACVLEGSVDGLTWTTLLSTNNLEHVSGDKWRFSVSGQKLSEYPGDRDVAAGEALAFSSRAAEPEIPMLENLGTVSVSSGATLRTTGLISPVVDSLAVDGVSGSGTITGFTFADNVTVNVTGRPRNSPSGVIAIDFSGCKGFDKARWTFLEDGKPPVRRSFRMTENGIVVTNHGFRLILR